MENPTPGTPRQLCPALFSTSSLGLSLLPRSTSLLPVPISLTGRSLMHLFLCAALSLPWLADADDTPGHLSHNLPAPSTTPGPHSPFVCSLCLCV
jgi:hypothetical protein